MQTRSFYAQVPCASVSELSKEQQKHVKWFRNRDCLIAIFEENNCEWCDPDVAPRAFLKMTIKVADILQHNPNEGVWVYGASSQDIARVQTVLGERVVTAHGNRIEGWR